VSKAFRSAMPKVIRVRAIMSEINKNYCNAVGCDNPQAVKTFDLD